MRSLPAEHAARKANAARTWAAAFRAWGGGLPDLPGIGDLFGDGGISQPGFP